MFGIRLRQVRKEKGLTLDELAELYNSKFNGGLNKGTLSKYENGKQEPMISAVDNLATILNVSIDYLLGKENNAINDTISITKNTLNFEINPHETKVITAYHEQIDMQPAVDKLLGITNKEEHEDENDKSYLEPIAAHLDGELTKEKSTSLQKDIQKVLALKNKCNTPSKS